MAWVDLMAGGGSLGRSVLSQGKHAERHELPPSSAEDPLAYVAPRALTAPRWIPSRLVNRLTAGAFNAAWFRKSPRRAHGRQMPFSAYFYPLDGLDNWNRLYGRAGLVQHQSVVPLGEERALERVVEVIHRAELPSALAVLKRFGPGNDGFLSFPMEGWTLALDLPASPPDLGSVLDEVDRIVVESGGRIYLAKDAVVRPDVLAQMYPRLGAWQEVQRRVDPQGQMRSDQAVRLHLVDA